MTAVSLTGDWRSDDAFTPPEGSPEQAGEGGASERRVAPRRPWTRVQPSSPSCPTAAEGASLWAAEFLPSPEMEGEDGSTAAAANGGATRVVGATGALFGVALEATTERPNDFRRSTNWVAVMPSNVVLPETWVLTFSAYDTDGCVWLYSSRASLNEILFVAFREFISRSFT